MPSFALLHSHEYDREVSLCAFDLLELNGTEVRKQPLVERKELLADFLAKVKDGIEFNDPSRVLQVTLFRSRLQARARGYRRKTKRPSV
jgi:ATP-dependent DNA ligase